MGTADIEASPAVARLSSVDIAKTHVGVGRQELHSALPPHDTYEGGHRWDPLATWTAEEEKKVVRKTDLRLLSWLCLMFFGLQLDRGNLSNALADDLLVDLGLTTDDYNNLMVCWGLVSIHAATFQAFMTGRTGFYISRAFIGLFEGGFIPGVILMATYFYTSKELSIRLAAFWSTLNIARVISALLAAGFLEMRGVGGHPGWFWLLLLEGLLTVVIGFASMAYLPTSPTGTKSLIWRNSWYTEREEVIMINRILRDDPAKGLTALKEPATLADVKAAWSDRSLWGLYFVGLVAYIPATPVTAYLTLTLKRVGNFSTLASNLLTAPSAALQIITMLGLAYSSEYFNERSFHCLFGEIWALPLFTALLTIPDGGREWGRFSIITMISGYPYFHPLVSSWLSENTFDVKKRAIAAATYNVIVQIGSVIGSQIYRSWDAPYYKTGNKVCISMLCLSVVVFLVQRQYMIHLNKKKQAVWDQMTREQQVEYQTDKEARELDGNKRLDFRFAY
ncbi:hypothetical protein FZEAL_792 [Fusarium zealandicum]|uniref:Major facilitator superfamily transporter n=1 Tax=Fusarium zealandicum TaxID=1053134 RepID=A0A8H4UUP7_9HYPO|nr:hypothetical protein FZEAL_792 [Fusarium zealandicum]